MLPHRTQLMSTVLAQKQKSKPMKKIKDPNMSYIRRGKGGGGRGGRRREERESGRKKEGGGRGRGRGGTPSTNGAGKTGCPHEK